MNILGISALDKDSTATLVQDGRIIAAVSEERLTRVKQQAGFPYKAVQTVLNLSGLHSEQIDCVAYPFFEVGKEMRLVGRNALADVFDCWNKIRQRGLSHTFRHYGTFAKTLALDFPQKLALCDRQLKNGLLSLGCGNKLRRYDHQYCHAISSYFTSDFDRALVVTSDWYGSGKAGAIYVAEGSQLKLVCEIPFPHSLGVLYAGVTSALGFIPDRHEGKIVGLAAYGDPAKLNTVLLNRFRERRDRYDFLDPFDSQSTHELVDNFAREDVAAGHQHILETVLLKTIVYYLKRFGLTKVACAGGVFANVKLNQKIVDLPEVESVFVHPAMTDMGTGTGAALCAAIEVGDLASSQPMENVFLGPFYEKKEVVDTLMNYGLRYEEVKDLPKRIATILAEGKTVGRFEGRMEYGPRALGNRSILASTRDPSITKILNQKLQRNDFMPFSPATLSDKASKYYINSHKVNLSAQFMTVCLRCKPAMNATSPGTVHVDKTSRPQLVTKSSNPGLYAILKHTEKLTGVPSVINTSFNIHEEPIVCSPKDAMRVFVAAQLDYLAIDGFLVSQ